MEEKNYSVIGKSVTKKDVLAKVTGKAQYAADITLDNMLFGKVLRSTVPAAIVKKIDTSKAKELPGVVSVLTAKDIPGENSVGIIIKDEPILVTNKIRRIGDPLAIIAAETMEIAEEALGLIKVDLEELPVVSNIEQALDKNSPVIHGGESNILSTKLMVKGDVDNAFKECDIIIENSYKTSMISHMFIEPEAAVAKYEDGKITVWSSTQNTHFDRDEVARMLNMPQNRVRCICAETGGGFGGKLDISLQCYSALLAYYSKRPVKMVNTREESTTVSSKRHPTLMKYKTGAKKDGKLHAMEVEIFQDTGAYSSYGLGVITRSVVHSTGPYEVPNLRVKSTMVYTNNPMAGAMRGFGVPQVAIAHEGQMDALAKELNMTPVEIRLINALKVGSTTGTKQILDNSVGITETIIKAVEKSKEVISQERRSL
ncbi:molybdopterin-dependent oxidoreductase [Alkalicella caledoniensis]|uniref:Molybdopterin-dependent oxidoreductase n=1 Tax=Alkalicella caledoniensis TaxID=2731377 RepID=A0A7G9WB22_ALKCA|nr:molybdopterin cofactor-binding domain-containing protein [Alkalicella caledoniensis]QNO15884.1 molybdopterin-dependent oxidoreductase [Alkalicella caledoniensis]